MHGDPQQFLESAATPLGWYYLAVAVLNAGAAVYWLRRPRRPLPAAVWGAVALGFAVLAWRAFAGSPLVIPAPVRAAVDAVLGLVAFTVGTFLALVLVFVFRRFFVRPAVAWTVLDAALLFVGASMTDPAFAGIVAKPDNVPIAAMVFLLGFFTWLATAQAVANDERMARGRPPVEADHSGKVLVWPDVVYLELIGMVIGSVVLIVWSLALKAPLEQPANPVVTPNPSKAPWYFLGLQEMLVYFPPSIAGVILPGLIILGLMAIPYLDPNPKGSGYYTIRQRPLAYVIFQFGFLQLWILLILIGTFMRGPNWSFFGLYEPRDPHKVLSLSNVTLAEYFWAILLGRGVPQVAPGSGALAELAGVLWRELPGVIALLVYFVALPVVLGRTVFRNLRRQMGRGRYLIMVLLLLMMLALPLKMILAWTFHLSYVLNIPEYSFQF